MTSSAGGRLGIDFGTSHTVAAVASDGRPIQLLLFDATPLLPSGVCIDVGQGRAGPGACSPGGTPRSPGGGIRPCSSPTRSG